MFLLADGIERLQNVSRYIYRQSGDPWGTLAFWVVTLSISTALLLLGLRVARAQRRAEAMGHPWRAFHELLGELPLSWGQRRRLARVARAVSPNSPAAILLTPSALDESIRRWGAGRPEAIRKEMAVRLAPAFAKLFNPRPG